MRVCFSVFLPREAVDPELSAQAGTERRGLSKVRWPGRLGSSIDNIVQSSTAHNGTTDRIRHRNNARVEAPILTYCSVELLSKNNFHAASRP
jgi:hypothetical protein